MVPQGPVILVRRNWQVWLDKYADPDWRLAHRMWSVRLIVLYGLLNGAYGAWPVFMEYVSPFWYALINVGLAVAVGLARLTNQSGFSNGSPA